MFGLGPMELIVILLIALLLFGAKRLPEIGKSIGKSINAFKEGLRESEDEITKLDEGNKKKKKS